MSLAKSSFFVRLPPASYSFAASHALVAGLTE
jgi:hypothetical protein